MHGRSKKLGNILEELGVKKGDRVATLAMNTYRHMELYFAVSGAGAVLHTLNPRLFAETLTWIVHHAQDSVLFFDPCFASLVERLLPHCPSVKHWICLVDEERMPVLPSLSPSSPFLSLHNYEALLREGKEDYVWPILEETAASSLCYTSGTTGIPYTAAMVGCKLVLPGSALDGASLYELMKEEGVTLAAGVPTVWLPVLHHLDQDPGQGLPKLRRLVIGGAACPPSMLRAFKERHGIEGKHLALPTEDQHNVLSTQGRTIYGVDLRIVAPSPPPYLPSSSSSYSPPYPPRWSEVPWDGVSPGELCARGHWVATDYFSPTQAPEEGERDGGVRAGHQESFYTDDDGERWFLTGDVATICPDGYIKITDRSKDVIKSGGEWISSIELENIATNHPEVALAAVIAMPHRKWDERPLLIVVLKDSAALSLHYSTTSSSPSTSSDTDRAIRLTKEALLDHFKGKVAKWWVPDDVIFVDSLPQGPTGKILKTELRQRFSRRP
ncbi:acyl-CoA synthetase [Nannochloropsis gaditana CCMP526]|uniref:acyl-CoA synthetase n=1 Tax=Nannochloropsis gaditana (strain CCMP526) TaxID=1093141 RepID=UPI00029F513B|nr:acyl-CoA synthetase [Nannochloropsis gaditana CCMP526]EKU20430.1 acyl-CoA synthetase [Nannochloropsis gaditana CCMP526]|eukprot:XP_005855929.1 acyl-CoA synthetase [Nannochloropsis gaditana CCMP526]